ncbi:MAG: aminotransferase class IV [Actinobacteria bacterium]|nr:aminotransferase class IV [Actinomycetota bacterium]
MDSGENDNELVCYLNGNFVPESKLLISPLDRGFLLGDGVFETVKAMNSVPLRFPQHYERMATTARFLEIEKLPTLDEVASIVIELLNRNNLKDAYIRITASSGREDSSSPTLFVMARPFKPYPKTLYSSGASIIISRYRKYELTPAAKIKTTSYEENLILRREAGYYGCLESVVCNHENFVCEGSFSNIFAIIDGRVVTPDRDLPILAGVTRQAVIETCRENNIDVVEDRFFLDDFLSAEEAFLSSTLLDIMPIAKALTYPEYDKSSGPALTIKKIHLKTNVIGTGKPGTVTMKLMKLFKQKINLECRSG